MFQAHAVGTETSKDTLAKMTLRRRGTQGPRGHCPPEPGQQPLGGRVPQREVTGAVYHTSELA